MTAERSFRRLLVQGLPKPDFEFTPIESRGTVDGIPDTYWCNGPARASGWLELKVVDGWTVALRSHQIGWLQRHARAGVRCAVAVRQIGRSQDGTPRDVLWLLAGHAAAQFAAEGLPRDISARGRAGVLGRYTGGPRQWSYKDIAAALVQG
jgi:hypothetical protein